MGWFSSSSSKPADVAAAESDQRSGNAKPDASAATSSSSGPTPVGKFPDKDARKACWATRDTFLSCLDAQYGMDSPSRDPDNKCARQFASFLQACPHSWVNHFMQRREKAIRDRKMGLAS